MKAQLLLSSITVLLSASQSFAGIADNYRQAVLADNPLGYWRLDELAGSTTVSDTSPHGRTGTRSGNVLFGIDGPTGSTAARFGGGQISFYSSSPTAFRGVNSVAVEAWIRMNPVRANPGMDPRGVYDIVSYGMDQFAGSYRFNTNSWESPNLQWKNAWAHPDNFQVRSPARLDDFQWYHVVSQVDATSGQGQMYINGMLVDESSQQPFTWTLSAHELRFGGMPGYGAYQYFGDLAEVAVYSGPLSAERVQAHWLAAQPVPEPTTLLILGPTVYAFLRRKKVTRD